MKKYSAFGLIVLIFVFGLVTSCGKDDEPVDPIVGMWEFSEMEKDDEGKIVFARTIVLTFNPDNTGLEEIDYIIYGQPDSNNSNIVWLTKNNVLTLFYGVEPNDYTYSISGDKLTISYSDEDIIYTRISN